MRLDDLARAAGVATTTVRLYQRKGLLPGPRLVGRTGYYDEHHLARLRLIGRLQDQGFSLAGIARLLESWEQGRDLANLVGVEQQLDQLLNRRMPVELDAAELVDRFPPGTLTPQLVRRAARLGHLEATGDGRFRVTDRRFLDMGAALAQLGIPPEVVLDEWEHLAHLTDAIAERFIVLFETHLLPTGWRDHLDPERASQLAATLAHLQQVADQVIQTAFDTSIAKLGTQRLAELIPPPQGTPTGRK